MTEPVEHRGETPLERADRNRDELLGELRVAQTGVAILFSLLLTVPSSARFDSVDAFQRRVHLVALLCAAASAVVLTAPVADHRVLFAQRRKPAVVRASNRFVFFGLALLCLATAAVLLVADVLLERAVATAVEVTFGVATAGLWLVPGMLRRAR